MTQVILVEDNTDRINEIIAPKGNNGGLYLGSQVAALDLQLLNSLGIKSIITIASQLPNKYPMYLVHMRIDIDDQPLAYIYQYFQPSYAFIRNQMKKGNVFIHCKMGISRSASLVIAYIMRKYRCSYQKAFSKVKSKRSKINPNEGFKMQLKQYQKKVAALQKK